MAWLFEESRNQVPKSGDGWEGLGQLSKQLLQTSPSAVGLGRWGGKGADLRNQRNGGGVAE